MTSPTDWTPLLVLLACVAGALSAAWWPRVWRWARRHWLVWQADGAMRLLEAECAAARNRAVDRVLAAIERSRDRQRRAHGPEWMREIEDELDGPATERSKRDG